MQRLFFLSLPNSESVERQRRETRVSCLTASLCSQDTHDLTIFKKNKRLLAVCIPFKHFIEVTRVFSTAWKSHKPILYFTSVTTDHSQITVGFSFGAEIQIVSSIQSYNEFL